MIIISTPNYPACTGNYSSSKHELDMAPYEHVVYTVICTSNYYYVFNLTLDLLGADIERQTERAVELFFFPVDACLIPTTCLLHPYWVKKNHLLLLISEDSSTDFCLEVFCYPCTTFFSRS